MVVSIGIGVLTAVCKLASKSKRKQQNENDGQKFLSFFHSSRDSSFNQKMSIDNSSLHERAGWIGSDSVLLDKYRACHVRKIVLDYVGYRNG